MHRETTQSEKLYAKVAARYEQVFERAIMSENRLTELTRAAMNGRRVLDLACGNGRWLGRFQPASYVGVDLNARMLSEARQRYPSSAFLRGEMTRLPFPDGAFEGVISMFGAMGHLPPTAQRAMVRETGRVLAPGGCAIFTNGNMWSPFNLPTALKGNRVLLEGVFFKVHSSTPKRFAQLLDEFEIARLEAYDYSYIPLLPFKFGASLLGRDYRQVYGRLMATFDHCRDIAPLQWFGKQLLAVCHKRS